MTATSFAAALAAAQGIIEAGAAPLPAPEESKRLLSYEATISKPSGLLGTAARAAELGVSTTIEWVKQDRHLTLATDAAGRWRADTALADVITHLQTVPEAAEWDTSVLLADGGADELDTADTATARVQLDKDRWSAPIEQQTSRNVWIGASLHGLAVWLTNTSISFIVSELFGTGQAGANRGALLLVLDAAEIAGARRLVLATPENYPAQSALELPVAMERVQELGDPVHDPARWQLLDAQPGRLPPELSGPLVAIQAVAAAALIAQRDARDRLRPSLEQPVFWHLPEFAPQTGTRPRAITALARWVAQDLSQTRLDVARMVAAATLPNPLASSDADHVLQTANTSYYLHVHEDVLATLDRQRDLEQAFHELDDKAQDMRSKIAENLDSTMTRVLAASLAVAIAALTSAKVRNWPATIAASVLAAYLLWTARTIWSWQSSDIALRLGGGRELMEARPVELGADIGARVKTWEADLRGRVKRVVVFLCAIALALVLGGLLANEHVRDALGIESAHAHSTPGTTVPRHPTRRTD